MQPELMMGGGLITVAVVEAVIDVVQADPPIKHDLRAPSVQPAVAFDGGALALATRHAGIVRLYLATEAGRISIIDLEPRDAATAGALIAGVDPEQIFEAA